ncbi:hypothetical protein [Lapidilactobacillus wuchangensis]|uniref:hypothetical protein n=1 Tax=Lapidilactobacillus wuchangensis TaxID=2486001 RepID=UPI000F774B6F|nr:hypothetical protein [Lapidilactobacillus wuchangensis]
MSQSGGILIGLIFIVGGIAEFCLAGHFYQWLKKRRSPADFFSWANLGIGDILSVLLLIPGIFLLAAALNNAL